MSTPAHGREHLLSVAVPCNWESCGNMTRDPSMYCVHHQRVSRPGGTAYYRDGQTILSRIRASVMGSTSTKQSPEWMESARVRAGETMDRYPITTRESWGPSSWGWKVRHAVDQQGDMSGLVVWDGREMQVSSQGMEARGAVLTLDGDDLLVRTDQEPGADPEVTRNVATMMSARWGLQMERVGALSGYGEQYDDRAEIMAQFPFDDDPDIGIRFSVVDEDTMTMTRTDRSGADPVHETYGIKTSWDYRDRLGRFTKVAMPTHASTTASGDRTRLIELDSDTLADRQDLVTQVVVTNDLISKYSTKVRGKLYLPQGWTDRMDDVEA